MQNALLTLFHCNTGFPKCLKGLNLLSQIFVIYISTMNAEGLMSKISTFILFILCMLVLVEYISQKKYFLYFVVLLMQSNYIFLVTYFLSWGSKGSLRSWHSLHENKTKIMLNVWNENTLLTLLFPFFACMCMHTYTLSIQIVCERNWPTVLCLTWVPGVPCWPGGPGSPWGPWETEIEN